MTIYDIEASYIIYKYIYVSCIVYVIAAPIIMLHGRWYYIIYRIDTDGTASPVMPQSAGSR